MIAKICGIVIFAWSGIACNVSSGGVSAVRPASPFSPPRIVGRITSNKITESSGLAASPCQAGVFWTHNDSGGEPEIFAIAKDGSDLGSFIVDGAANIDWEDIAASRDRSGRCFIYVGDIGDNRLRRSDYTIYRVAEPVVSAGSGAKLHAEILTYSYPERNANAEMFFVHPYSGSIYVATKRVDGPSQIFRVHAAFGAKQKAELVAELSLPAVPNGTVTGGDISPDGRHVVLSDYAQGYEFTLPADEKDFERIWKVEPIAIDLGKRKTGESICYLSDGSGILAGSEGRESPIFEVIRKPYQN